MITNKRNLPLPVVRALEEDDYDGPDADGTKIGVTSLIGPARIRGLKALHPVVDVDASDQLHALLGKAFHLVMRAGAEPGAVVEQRIDVQFRGWTISGQIDYLKDGVLSDYKTCSAWAIMRPKQEWEAQLNIYRWLARKANYEVSKLQIVAFLKDLEQVKKSLVRSRSSKEVPDCDIQVVELPIWGDAILESYMAARIFEHERAATGDLPLCSTEETWEGKRCAKYCPVAPVCEQANPGNWDPFFKVEV